MTFRNIKSELLLLFSIAAIFAIAIIVVISAYYITSIRQDNEQKSIQAQNIIISNTIKATIEKNFAQAISISQTFSSVQNPIKKAAIDREQATWMLREVINQNSMITDIYMLWEKNAFDGNDLQYKDAESSDSSGRFVPHWQKLENNEIVLNTYTDNKLKKSLKNIILSPITYRENGKTNLKLPLVSPIMNSEVYYGITVINISLDWVQTLLEKQTYQKDRMQISLVSSNGTIIAISNNKYLVGKSLNEAFEDFELYINDLGKGKSFVYSTENEKIYGIPCFVEDSETPLMLIVQTTPSMLSGSFLFDFFSITGIIIVIFVISLILINILLNRFVMPIRILVENSTKLIKGDLEFEAVEFKSDNELKQLYQAFSQVASSMKDAVSVSESISKGDFSKFIDVKSEKDILAKAINTMNETLKLAKEDSAKREKEDEIRNWMRQGMAKLVDSQRTNAGNMDDLANNIIQTLINYVDASIGGLFLYNNSNHDDIHMELVAAYALDVKKHYKKRIEIGEGIAGACAFEQKTIFVTNIPEQYLEVTSGLGSSKPKCIIVVPLIFENQLLGVLELAFLHLIEKYKIEFIEQITENIAASLSNAKISAKTVELLEQSQKQAEILVQKEQEVRQNLEMIQIAQKESAIREAEMRGILDAVNNTILTIEYTTEGILLNANEKYLKTSHYSLDEIRGINVLELVKDERDELKQIIDGVKKGKFYEKEVKRFTKFGEVKWFLSTYTPFYDINGDITKVMYFAIDNTERKQLIDSLKIKEIELQKRVDELEHFIEEITKEQLE